MKIDVLKTIKSHVIYKKSQIEELKIVILDNSSLGEKEVIALDFTNITWIKKKLDKKLSKFVNYLGSVPNFPAVYYDAFDDTLILTKKEIKKRSMKHFEDIIKTKPNFNEGSHKDF